MIFIEAIYSKIIRILKQYLHKSLEDCGEEVSFAIQKANAYMSLKTQHLQFLDIRSD